MSTSHKFLGDKSIDFKTNYIFEAAGHRYLSVTYDNKHYDLVPLRTWVGKCKISGSIYYIPYVKPVFVNLDLWTWAEIWWCSLGMWENIKNMMRLMKTEATEMKN